MYILLESASGEIRDANICEIDAMGAVATEREAIEWYEANPDYRTYKYVRT